MLVVGTVTFHVVEVSFRVGLETGGVLMDVSPDAASIIEALVEIGFAIPVEVMQAGDLVPSQDVDFVIDYSKAKGLEKAGSVAAPCHLAELCIDA